MSKSQIIKKVFFWILFGVSLLLLVLSIFMGLKPEWFEGLPTFFGWDEATNTAMLATFGFGGTAGTLGFSIAKASLSGALDKGKSLSKDTIKTVETHTLDIVKNSDTNYKDILQKFTSQNETISLLVQSVKDHKEAFDALSETVRTLIGISLIDLNKTLDNPLVNQETKDKIRAGLESIGVLPKETIEVVESKEITE